MRAARSLLARSLLQFYPRAWRDRYGDELLALVEDTDSGIGGLVDLGLDGLRQRLEQLGGGGNMNRVNSWAALVAGVIALLVAMPTAAFIAVNLFPEQIEWLTGLRGPIGVGPGVEWMLPALPVFALVIAIGPAMRVRMRRDPSDRTLALTVRVLAMPRWLRAVLVVCAVLVAFVVAYGLSENLLEALR